MGLTTCEEQSSGSVCVSQSSSSVSKPVQLSSGIGMLLEIYESMIGPFKENSAKLQIKGHFRQWFSTYRS